MIGQRKLLDKINQLDYITFPHSLLLVGDKGCGKHTIVNEIIQPLLNIPVIDITEHISSDTITDIILNVNAQIYLIDTDLITIREQNVILKFLEEPTANAFIILFTTNKGLLLDTIVNRCTIWQFEKYSDEELLNFTKNPELLKTANTPGKLLKLENSNYAEIEKLCDAIISKSQFAAIGNVLGITNKLAYKNEPELFDVDLFIDALIKTVTKYYLTDPRYFRAYELTRELTNKLNILHVDKSRLIENYLLNLKFVIKEDMSNGT